MGKCAEVHKMSNFLSLAFASVILISVLILVNVQYGFLLFHSLAELVCVVVGIIMFIVACNTHTHIKNYFLLYLGIGYFWVSLLDLCHLLTYEGMPFLNISSTNVTLHFWIYARGFEAFLMLSAALFLNVKFNPTKVFVVTFVATALLLYLAIYQEQPIFFIDGQGLTLAKILSEYAIIATLMFAIILYWRAEDKIIAKLKFYLILSIMLTIVAELFFTQYVSVYGLSNQIGHVFKVLSFVVIFFAFVLTMLKDPFSLLTLTAHSYDAIPQPAIVVDHLGIIRQANQSAKSVFNIDLEDRTHFHFSSHDQKIDVVDCEICQHLQLGKAMSAKVFENTSNRTWQLISLTPIQPSNHETGFIQITVDVSKQIEEKRSFRLAGAIFDNLSEGILVTDENLRIVSINKAVTNITGYTKQDVLNKKPSIFASGRHDDAFYKAMWQQIHQTDQWQGEIWNRKKSGIEYPELLSIKVLRAESGEVSQYVSVFSDISQLKAVENKLRYQAHHDLLTDLPNRLMFKNHLEAAMKHCKRNQSKLALLFVDIDNFKSINDSLGHTVGDSVIISVSKHIKTILRDDDIIGRYGGDEFVILLENIESNDNLSYIAEKLINSLTQPIFYYENMPIFISISIGLCLFPDDANSVEQLIQYADSAMYKAKKAGKNHFVFHSSKDNDKAKRRLLLESRLREAIENNEIYIVYQPKINADTYQISGAEALVRWNNPVLGEVYPDEFIPLAESIGVIHKLGEFVLRQALVEVGKWRKISKRNLSVAVNFSSKQFIRGELDEVIKSALHASNLPSEALEVEITESLLLNKSKAVKTLLQSISASGVSIAIDDFGTGYSALSYLKNYPINVVKIDKSFIDGVDISNEDSILVKTIIVMAHGLGMSVVAEGVENKQQLAFFQNEQGDTVQGYYFSKPLLKGDFINTLQNWNVKIYRK